MREPGGKEPAWLPRLAVETIHRELVRKHGGSFGLRDEGCLEAALDRPRNRWADGEDPSLAELAAVYADGLVRNHPFVDGNKRIALMAAYVFLELNGRELNAPEPEAVVMMVALNSGEASVEEFAAWVRQNLPAFGGIGRQPRKSDPARAPTTVTRTVTWPPTSQRN